MAIRVGADEGGVIRSRMSPWHDAQSSRASVTWRWCENMTCGGRTRVTRVQPNVWRAAAASHTAAVPLGAVAWHFAQNATSGIVARVEAAAPLWQTVHAIARCFACGKAIGCVATAAGSSAIHAAATTTVSTAAGRYRRI